MQSSPEILVRERLDTLPRISRRDTHPGLCMTSRLVRTGRFEPSVRKAQQAVVVEALSISLGPIVRQPSWSAADSLFRCGIRRRVLLVPAIGRLQPSAYPALLQSRVNPVVRAMQTQGRARDR